MTIAAPVFGSKGHLGIDRVHGLIRTSRQPSGCGPVGMDDPPTGGSWTVTHAAAHDSGQLGNLLDSATTANGVPRPSPDGRRFADGSIAYCDRWADTAYRLAANPELLARRDRVGHLQRKKPCGKPMPRHVARGTTRRGKVRAAVEHVFAAQKRRLGLIIRTVGITRARAKIGLANLAYNLIRFARLRGRAAPA